MVFSLVEFKVDAVVSSSLLQLVSIDKSVSQAFSLGMDNWLDDRVFMTEP